MADALADDGTRAIACAIRPNSCARRSKTSSGARNCAPTRWRSTARSVPAAFAPPMPATACSAASRRPSGRAWSAKASSASRCFRAGAFGRSRPRSCATTRCRTHNGSVWPHDNGMIAAGSSRYHLDDLIARAVRRSLRCQRHDGRPPPAGAVLWFPSPQRRRSHAVPGRLFSAGVGVGCRVSLHSGLSAAVGRRRSPPLHDRSRHPAAPFLTYLRLRALTLPFGAIDLLFEQHPLDVSVTVLRKDGDFDVQVLK